MHRNTQAALNFNVGPGLDGESKIADQLLFKAAIRMEKYLAYTRLSIVFVLLVRYIALDPPFLSIVITIPAVCVIILFSTLFFIHYKRTQSKNWMWASILLDACLGFISLFNYVLTEESGRWSIMYLPDTAFLLIVCYANGLRLHTPMALVGGVVNLLFFLVVVGLDDLLNGMRIMERLTPLSMWLVSIVSAITIAVITAIRTKSLVIEGARESVRNEQLRSGVKSVLQGHHDAHSLISSVYLNADQLIKSVSKDSPGSLSIARNLKDDLQSLTACLKQVMHTSDDFIRTSETIEIIDLGDTVSKTLVSLQSSYSPITIERHIVKDPIPLAIVDGENSIKRILSNLLKNAAEGNGKQGSNLIRISVTRDDQQATLVVEDNGPGFVPLGQGAIPATGKTTGMKVGLFSIIKLVDSSHGDIQFDTSTLGGAKVTLTFPLST